MNAIVYDPVIDIQGTRELELEIIKLVKKSPSGIDINMILRTLDHDHERYAIIKETVWRLISAGEIKLTPERKLSIPD